MDQQRRLGLVGALLVVVMGGTAACGGATASTASTASSASTSTKQPIEIGVAAGITGYLAAADAPLTEGIKFAAERLNKNGGVDGHKLNVHVVDMASTASTGVTVVNQLLNQYNVGVIMTGAASAATAAEAPIVAPHKVPMITFTVLNRDPTWVFSVLPLIDHIVDAELQYASKGLHASSIGFLYSQTPYGQQASKLVNDTAQSKFGLKVVENSGVDATATDVSPLLARIRDAHADAIVTVLTGPIQIVLAKNAAALGLTQPVVQANDDVSVQQQAAVAYQNTYFDTTAPEAYPNITDSKRKAAVEAFLADWKAAGHSDLTGAGGAGAGWDEVQLLASAVQASHATTGDALRDALEKATLTGTTTDYAYSPSDHTGQQKVPIPFAIGQYKGGALQIISPFPK